MELFWLGVYGIALFAISAFVSALYYGRNRRGVEPLPGTWITLRSGGAHLRCRFVAAKRGTWVVTPLTTVGSVSPLRQKGEMLGLFGTQAGVVVFTTQVLGTDGSNVLLTAPRNARIRDRRLSPRVQLNPTLPGTLDGIPVMIHNLGTRGALVTSKCGLAQGTEVSLRPDGTVARLTGFVLACDAFGEEYHIRLLFDREVPLSFCWDLATPIESS